ncbi:MAG: hypothetical protein WC635_14925 [Bacteriovorax sp.]|jgi:hypothetical protein
MKQFCAKRLVLSTILIASLALTSCGFMSDKPPANTEVYKVDDLQGCKIDVTKLGEIFKSDQEEQIRCLQENFIQFTKYVRSEDTATISIGELTAFVKKFFPTQSEAIIKGLGILFQLNMVLLRDDPNKISRFNIRPFFNFLVKLNKEAVQVNQILDEIEADKTNDNFWALREKLNTTITRFSLETIKIIEKSFGPDQYLNLKEFILEVGNKIESTEITPETVDSLLFIKKILAGGKKEYLSSQELKSIVSKLPKLLISAFDLYYVKKSDFQSQSDFSRFYLLKVRSLYNILQFDQPDFELFTIDQMIHLSKMFGAAKSFSDFKPSFMAIKSKIIHGNENAFYLSDIKVLLDMAHDAMEKIYFSHVTYNAYNEIMAKNEVILDLDQLDLPDKYDLFNQPRLKVLHNDFRDTAVNIRYFAGEAEKVPYYGNEIKRNRFGFTQSTLLTWLCSKMMLAYGHIDSAGMLKVSVEELKVFLDDMKPILKEFRMLSPKPTMAQNGVMLADLFQNKSDGDQEIGLVEMTDYVQMMLSGAQVSSKFNAELIKRCDFGINPDDPLFTVDCFNEHFFDLLLNQLDLKKSVFPGLQKYVTDNTPEKLNEYLKGVQGYARDYPDPKIPINRRDSTLIMGAFINIESTFLRYDTNADNVIDFNELSVAFKTYKQTIIKMAKLPPSKEMFAPSIFYYMVYKLRVPPTGTLGQSLKFFVFHKCVSSEKCRKVFLPNIEAKRLNIGKVLYYLANPAALSRINLDGIDMQRDLVF